MPIRFVLRILVKSWCFSGTASRAISEDRKMVFEYAQIENKSGMGVRVVIDGSSFEFPSFMMRNRNNLI
jgi:hypothetical protein